MARTNNTTRREDDGPRGAMRFFAIPLVLAVAVILVIAVYIGFIADQDPPGSEMPEDVGARPAGAGTNPDGVVDERLEGMSNETSTEDFIDNSQASDSRPAILDADEGPDPATSIEDLDVPERINEGVVDPGPPRE
jgi:hypothetical protein